MPPGLRNRTPCHLATQWQKRGTTVYFATILKDNLQRQHANGLATPGAIITLSKCAQLYQFFSIGTCGKCDVGWGITFIGHFYKGFAGEGETPFNALFLYPSSHIRTIAATATRFSRNEPFVLLHSQRGTRRTPRPSRNRPTTLLLSSPDTGTILHYFRGRCHPIFRPIIRPPPCRSLTT